MEKADTSVEYFKYMTKGYTGQENDCSDTEYEMTEEEQQLVNKLYERKEKGLYVNDNDWGTGCYDGVESPLKEDFGDVNIIAVTDWNDASYDDESDCVITEDYRIGYTCCDYTGYSCRADYKIDGPYKNYEELVLMGLTNADRKSFIQKYVG